VGRNDEVLLLNKTGVGQAAAEACHEWMGRFANPSDAFWPFLLRLRGGGYTYYAGYSK
jgi:hypothetical protein